jgi:hypothetical protein
VGTNAPNGGGVLSGIQGALTIVGTNNDTLNLDDSGSAAGTSASGILASQSLNGLGMGKIGSTNNNSITYRGLAKLNLTMGAANYTFGVTDTYVGSVGSTVTTINTGSGTNVVNIGSTSTPTPATHGTVSGIQGQLNINGGGFDTVNVDSTGSGASLSGFLTEFQLSGLGMGPGIGYSGTANSVGTSLFAAGDFAGLPVFAGNFIADPNQELAPYQSGYQLPQGATAITAAASYLATQFQAFAPTAVATMLNIYATPRQLQDAFIAALNAVVLNGASIYNAQVFTGVTLSSATQALMAQNPTQPSLIAQLNRLLLNDLFGSSLPQPRARLMTLNINLANTGNTFFAQGTSAWITNLNPGTGNNAIAIGTLAQTTFNAITSKLDANGQPVPGAGTSASTGSVLDHLFGDLTVNGSNNDTLNVDDTGSAVGRHAVMDATSLAVDSLGIIRFTGVKALDVSFGQGADQLQITDTFSKPDVYQSNFVDSDFFKDFPQLLLALTTQTNPSGVSGFLWSNMEQAIPGTQAILSSPTATLAQKQDALVAALNMIINRGSSIYDATVFNGIQLTSPTLTLIANTNRTADQTARLNRLLIEDTYPNLITRSAPTPVIYINGDGGEDVFAVFDTHCAVQLNGGSGNDTFYIFSNTSPLTLNGDDGDDTFYIFASIQSQEADASVDGGTGAAAIFNFRSNGHVDVDGGTGFNRLFVYGTILDDVITIDGNQITGAGLDISFTNISELDIAGLPGSDTFYIKSIITTTRILGDSTLPNFPPWIHIPPHFFDGRPIPLIGLPGSVTPNLPLSTANGVLSSDFNYTIQVLDQTVSFTIPAAATSGDTSPQLHDLCQ